MCLCQVVRPRVVPAIYPVNERQPNTGPRILLEVFFIAIQRPSPRRSRPISQPKRSSSRSWRLRMLPRARGIRRPAGRHDNMIRSRHRGRQKTRRLGQYERNGPSGTVGFDSINRPVRPELKCILVLIHLVHVPCIRCRECPAVTSLARRPADAISDLKDQRSSVGNFPRAGQIACNRLPMRIGFVVRNEHDQLAVQQLQDRRSPAERNLLPRSHDRRPKPRAAAMHHQSPSPPRAIPVPRKGLQATPMVPPPPLLKVNPLMRDHHRPFTISRRQRHTGSIGPRNGTRRQFRTGWPRRLWLCDLHLFRRTSFLTADIRYLVIIARPTLVEHLRTRASDQRKTRDADRRPRRSPQQGAPTDRGPLGHVLIPHCASLPSYLLVSIV